MHIAPHPEDTRDAGGVARHKAVAKGKSGRGAEELLGGNSYAGVSPQRLRGSRIDGVRKADNHYCCLLVLELIVNAIQDGRRVYLCCALCLMVTRERGGWG